MRRLWHNVKLTALFVLLLFIPWLVFIALIVLLIYKEERQRRWMYRRGRKCTIPGCGRDMIRVLYDFGDVIEDAWVCPDHEYETMIRQPSWPRLLPKLD